MAKTRWNSRIISFVSLPSFSSTTCSGIISGVTVNSSGQVYATMKSTTGVNLEDVSFCNLNTTSGDYSGDSCKGLLSLLTTGQAIKSNASLWVKQDNYSCTGSWIKLSAYQFYHFKLN
jgi:hypothetical protein